MHSSSPGQTKSDQNWTILSLLNWSTEHLMEKEFEDARLNVELLLTHVLGLSRIELYMNYDRNLSATELADYKSIFQRRLRHEPLQYILGHTEFMGIPIHVNPSVLIPRSETEQLVEFAVEYLISLNHERINVLDIGTGSGNIPIAIASLVPRAEVISIDVSSEALETASKNLAANKTERVTLLHIDVFSKQIPPGPFDLVISNPPYISKEEFALLESGVRDFEPRVATTDEGDGTKFIRRVAEIAGRQLKTGGALLMEIAYNQGVTAELLVRGEGLAKVEILKDYAGHQRFVRAVK